MSLFEIHIPEDRGKLYEVTHYPAGEIQVRLTPVALVACKDETEYRIIANPIPDFIELAQLTDALNAIHLWRYRGLFLPYLPYARADRRFVTGDAHGLGVYAALLNGLNFTAIDTFDVHSDVALHLIPHLHNMDPIYTFGQVGLCIRYLGSEGLVLILPDKGAQSRYDLHLYNLPILIGGKVRDPETGKLSGFTIPEDVKKYKKGLIIDDICDGGGTFLGLGEKIHELNPEMELNLYTSHAIYSKGTHIMSSQFKWLFTSDFTFKAADYNEWEKVGE